MQFFLSCVRPLDRKTASVFTAYSSLRLLLFSRWSISFHKIPSDHFLSSANAVLHSSPCVFVHQSASFQPTTSISTPRIEASTPKAIIALPDSVCPILELTLCSDDRLSLDENSINPKRCGIRFVTAPGGPDASGIEDHCRPSTDTNLLALFKPSNREA
jgi:hypothetical protein